MFGVLGGGGWLLVLTFSFRTKKNSLLEFPIQQKIWIFKQLTYLFSLSVKTFGLLLVSIVKLSFDGSVSFFKMDNVDLLSHIEIYLKASIQRT